MKKLTDKETLFCHEYMKDQKKSLSYMRAYKTKNAKSAAVLANRLLKKVNVSNYLNNLKANYIEKIDITAEWVIKGIKTIGDKQEAKDSDKLKAYELGGKLNKMFTDNKQVDINYDITQLPGEWIEKIANAKGNEEILKIIAEYERLKTAS